MVCPRCGAVNGDHPGACPQCGVAAERPRPPELRLDPRGLSDPAETALIGVSGGCDSVSLLHALRTRGFARLVVCHLDHGWREESAAEAKMVAELAASYGLPFETEKLTPGPAEPSPENRGRAARLAFFALSAAKHGCAQVYLAHHADDQVETLLLHLFRGAGAGGLGGMAPESPYTIGATTLQLLRPLLGIWRAEIDAYAAEHRLPFCHDASNADPRYTRNRMRHEVIPLLEQAFGQDVRQAVWRAAEILTAENALVAGAPELQDLSAELETSRLRALPLALQRRLLHAWLKARGVAQVEFLDVENTRALLEPGGPAKVNLHGGRHARRRAGRLFVE